MGVGLMRALRREGGNQVVFVTAENVGKPLCEECWRRT